MKYGVFGLWSSSVLCYLIGAIILMWQTAMEAGALVIHTSFYNGVHVFGVVVIRYLLIGLLVLVLSHITTRILAKTFGAERVFPF